MDIRKGTHVELNQIIDLVKKTVKIMESEGNDQWTGIYPQEDDFIADINKGTLFIALKDEAVIGCITVDQEQAEEYRGVQWRLEENNCFVFHRLAVNPEIRGEGIASKLISFAESHAMENKVIYMRTDTYSLNKKAQKLFEKSGYTKVGTIYMGKEKPFYCYDKILK